MSKTTTNYGLTKPERSDNYSVDVMGNNMDIIDTKIKSIDNVVNGGAVKSSSITNSGTITSTGLITANGGVKGNLTGNATTATNLSRTVTVGVSSTEYSVPLYTDTMLLPYTPGVLYTGKIKGYVSGSNVPATLHK